MNAILVLTNFSKLSDNAIQYAASLAQLFETKLIMFNAFKLPLHASNTLMSADSINDLIQTNKDKLQETALTLTNQFNIEVDYICDFVDLENEVDYLMETLNPRLLVMGMSPKSMEQNLLGNPTTTLISMKKFPVLAIPLHAKFNGMKKILFACDLMQDIPLKTLASLREIAVKLKSEVTVFYVESKINELAEKIDPFDDIDREFEGITHFYKNVRSNAIIEEIRNEIKKSNADLLVMIPKKYGFWQSVVHKSKTRVMASGMDIPLLSIPIE